SLGCLTFEMATGRPPFVASSIGEACNMHLHDPPPSLRAHAGSLPQVLDTLVTAALSKDPAEPAPVAHGQAKLAAIAEGASSMVAPTLDGPAVAPLTSGPPVSAGATTRAEADTTLGSSAGAVEDRRPARSKIPLLIGAGAVVAAGITVFAVTRGGSEKPAT